MKRPFGKLRKVGNNSESPDNTGDKTPVSGSIFCYNEENIWEGPLDKLEAEGLFQEDKVTWVNVNGVHQPEILDRIDQRVNFHPLILEDIVNTVQRTKVEEYDDCLFIVLKMLKYNEDRGEVEAEQVSLVVGCNYVISFQEVEGDVFERIRIRLRENKGQVRRQKADYLMYSLVDAIVDNYFVILDQLITEIDDLEERLLAGPEKEMLTEIHQFQSQILALHRAILPLRDVLNTLNSEELNQISRTTVIYLRDIYDHLVRILDEIEASRELLNNLLDIYLSLSSHKMNEVMKILTIIATIFMPLTLIAGIYGMNFRYMPELEQPWGYPAVILVMVVIAVIMLIFFHRKKML